MISTDLLEECERLKSSGRYAEAIELLTTANRQAASFELERRLVELRYDAFQHDYTAARQDGPVEPIADPLSGLEDVPDPFTRFKGRPPEVTLDELTLDALKLGIKHHGCLVVRGLVGPSRVQRIADLIARSWESAGRFIKHRDSVPDDWYAPFSKGGDRMGYGRVWARKEGTLYAGDCPRAFFELLEAFREAQIDELAREYYGERVAISLQKCALRYIEPKPAQQIPLSMWHQDGKFLGEGIEALNVWIAFSEAGVDAPGIDVVPRRLESIVETGTDSAGFDWVVGEEVVRKVAEDTPPLTPSFQPGDAIIFDRLFLHTSSFGPSMTQRRLSSETWFIAESTYPADNWAPLAL